MSERRRRELYKKDDKDEDILKKLKEVRQNLQESLDDDDSKPSAPKPVRKRGERRLYKKEEVGTPIKKPVKAKPLTDSISKRRLAAVQKRVKAKVEESRGISKKKKGLIVFWLIMFTIPLFFMSSVAVASLELNFNEFGLYHNEQIPGQIKLSFPARNPTFLPAQLAEFKMELYAEVEYEPGKKRWEFVGLAYTDKAVNIAPFQTEKLIVTFNLQEDVGGKWLSDLLSDMKLSVKLGEISYSGITIDASFLPHFELDIAPMLQDAISGLLDIESLISGLSFEDLLGGSGPKLSDDGTKMLIDPYTNAKKKTLLPRMSQLPGMDDMTVNLSFGMYETPRTFNFGLEALVTLGDLISAEDLLGIELGPILLDNLSVDLMVNNETDLEAKPEYSESWYQDNWYKYYNTPIASLFSTKQNEIYIADKQNRDSIFGMNVSIQKDYIGGASLHPSSNVDWTDPSSVDDFLNGEGVFDIGGSDQDQAWRLYPGWYFLYNILGLGALDCGIRLNNVDVTIFGIVIPGVSLPMRVLPPLKLEEGILDPSNFVRFAPDYGLAGIFKHLTKGLTEGPARAMLGIPPESASLPPSRDLDTLLEDFMGMVEFPDFELEDIHESWGADANLSLTLPISINNSELNFYVGFENMKVEIGSEINNVVQKFMQLKLTGNGTPEVYIPGINTNVTIMVEVTIFKNSTLAPFAVTFLSSLIENYTIDGVIFASFDKLILFKENYTYGKFELAIPLVMDIESILMGLVVDFLPGLIGGLVDPEALGNQSSTMPLSPLSLYSMLNPFPALLDMLTSAPKLRQYAAQEEESSGILGDFITPLINDLINGIFGGILGSDMEFTLGLEVHPFRGSHTEFVISITDFYVDEFFLTVGLGSTDLEVQGKNPYTQAWERMIGLKVDDYFEIKAKKQEDIEITLTIYETDAFCAFTTKFITDFFNKSATNILDLRLAGFMTMNLSGIFLPELEIDFKLEGLDLGINGSDLIESLVDMVYTIELDDEEIEPKLLNSWAGPMDEIPFISQGLDLDALISMGEISVLEISEEDYGTQLDHPGGIRTASVKLSMDVVNNMMSVNIHNLGISVYNRHPTNKYGEGTPIKLIELTIDDEEGLPDGENGVININVTIFKTLETQRWLNNLINNFSLYGWINFSAKVEVFRCNFTILDSYIPAINLTQLPIDITTLFGILLPFSAPFLNMVRGPRGAQDIDMDSIIGPNSNVLNFGIGKIKMGEYVDRGPLDYDNYIFNVDIDLWLQLMFNLQINSLELDLLDGGLYKALYVDGGHAFDDVVREASIAKVELVKSPIAFDNVKPADRGIPGLVPYTTDPNGKPYVVNTSAAEWEVNETEPWVADVAFTEDIDEVTGIYGRNVGEGLNVTEFNRTAGNGGGFTDTNYLALGKPGLNNLSVRVGLYNKSHGTWGTKYPRQFWKALGGPYFPVQKYSGFPDHYYVYHKYYSPLVSFMHKVINLLDEEGIASDEEALNELITGIAIAGKADITVFGMNIVVDLGAQINALIEPVVGLFMQSTGLVMKEYLDLVTNPLKAAQDPEESRLEQLMMAQGIDEIFGELLDISSIPLDITDVIGGLTFPGIADRTTYAYNPRAESQGGASRTWDGWSAWGARDEYDWDPEDMPGYVGSLDDPYFTGASTTGTGYEWWHPASFVQKENFVKDYAYDWFKVVTDNWAESLSKTNPFFETHYTENGVYMGGDKIEDPSKWPLQFSRSGFNGRATTGVITMHAGVLPRFPLGVLSGRLGMYIEDPYEACQYMPMGYAWFDHSIELIAIDELFVPGSTINNYLDSVMPGFLTDNAQGITWAQIEGWYATTKANGKGLLWNPDDPDYVDKSDVAMMALGQAGTMGNYQIDNNGVPMTPGWVVVLNLRLFQGLGSSEFLWGLISDNFNIHFLAQGELNISIFGYEFYNLFLPYDILALGDASRFADRCEALQSRQGGGGYGNWGVPGGNGTVTGTPPIAPPGDDSYWPHYLLEAPSLEFAVSLPIDAILDFESFLDFGQILSGLQGIGFTGSGLRIDFGLDIDNPVPLMLIIESIYIEVHIDTDPNLGSPWILRITNIFNIPLIDIPSIEADPFDFRYNSYQNWHTPHEVSLQVHADIPLEGQLLGLLWALIMGDDIWMKVAVVDIDTIIPNTMSYRYKLGLDLGDIGEPSILSL
jgi:hypothetical protein